MLMCLHVDKLFQRVCVKIGFVISSFVSVNQLTEFDRIKSALRNDKGTNKTII